MEKDEIKALFEKIKKKSYLECSKSKIIFKDMKRMGFSSPFNGNIYINFTLIKKFNFNQSQVIGLLAHELSHQISYNQRTFFKRILFLCNYPFSKKKKKLVEHEADIIAIQRGYKNELLESRKDSIYDYKKIIKDEKKLKEIEEIYFSYKDLKKIKSNK